MKDFHQPTQHRICQSNVDDHCLTCSDEAFLVRVISIEPASGTAFIEGDNQTEEVDITLVDDIVPGDLLLVHGGVAIARQEKGEANVN